MKIVHILPEINKGGTERLVLTLAHKQAEKEDVYILVFNDLDLYPELTKGLKIIQVDSKTTIEYNLWGIKSAEIEDLYNKIKEIQPDVIHSHAQWTHLLLVSIPKFDAKYIAHFHLYYPEYDISLTAGVKCFVTSHIDLARLIRKYKAYDFQFVAISKDIYEYYKVVFPKAFVKRMYLIPNATNLLEFKKSETQKVVSNPIKLINVSRLVPIKNHRFLLQVIQRLKDTSSLNFQLTIFGDGQLRKELLSEIEALDLSNEIILYGNVENIHLVYHDFDLYVHAAKKEPFGLTCLEALSCGVPCVSLKAGGVEDVIENGINGFLVEESVEAYASKIEEVFKTTSLFQSLQANTTTSIQKFNFDDFYKSIENVYQYK